MNAITWLMTVLGLVMGLLLGVALYMLWLRHKAAEHIRLPHKWPLRARSVVNTDEEEVWTWMRSTFHDHVVMIKIPVLRYTIPIDKESGKGAKMRWLEMLNGVYTTFTVCSIEGRVLGCVDVRGKQGLSKATRELKERLLSDCGIPYTSVRSGHLPQASAMRSAFLGEMSEEVMSQMEEAQDTRGGASSFFADMDTFTTQRVQAVKDAALKELNKEPHDKSSDAKKDIGFNPDGTGGLRLKPQTFKTQFDDSFIQPSDSGRAKL